MDPTIAFRVDPHDGPVLEVRVNFGVYAGRNATPAEVDDLARSLRTHVPTFTIIAEERHQFGDGMETSLHQVLIEIDRQSAGDLSDEVCERIVRTADRWAAACIASRSELGELGD
ncbi:MAG: hypothetical protein ACXWYO_06065 [Gaiellaceae bacterium]